MNNAIYLGGKCIGFRCFQCGNIFQQMWDTTCNGCREKNNQHNELINEIKKLKEQLNDNTKCYPSK